MDCFLRCAETRLTPLKGPVWRTQLRFYFRHLIGGIQFINVISIKCHRCCLYSPFPSKVYLVVTMYIGSQWISICSEAAVLINSHKAKEYCIFFFRTGLRFNFLIFCSGNHWESHSKALFINHKTYLRRCRRKWTSISQSFHFPFPISSGPFHVQPELF